MNYIEKVFEQKATSNDEAAKYSQQWQVAKNYIPQLLNTISQFFPHYSLHDASHSETILNNIELILGKNVIDNLSIVDLWLLLSSAYYHDLGMTIDRDDIIECLKEGSLFVNYVKDKQAKVESPMHMYAMEFDIKDGKLYYKNQKITEENIDAQKFLFADFIRERHAERAVARIINEDSLHLPGNAIPERIVKILGNICKAHGQKQNELIQLAAEENSGCGTEKCHPLFVACMLRLGDLLDIDTNRVSKVLLSTLPSIPSDSLSYNQTNRDITHINIGRKLIEITAECKDYKVADLLNSWFKMIDEELQFQTKNWYKIAPSAIYGALPSAGNLIVRLKGYDDISGKNSLKFEINSSKAIEMLQGAGLYNDASQCIRELLQNAVDATYLRVYMENPHISDRKEFWKKCAEHRIEVALIKTGVEDNSTKWHLTIHDQGIGIAPEEIKFLTNTGSSDKNERKNKICKNMQPWMLPSGVFGIGFQSIFLITDKVNIQTRKWGTDNVIELEMFNPSGEYKGKILKKTYKDEFVSFGTKIDCEIEFEKHPGWSVHEGDVAAIETISTYDFAMDESFDIQAAKLIDEIEKFSEQSTVSIHLTVKEKDIYFSACTDKKYDYYDEEIGYEVSLGSPRYRKTSLYFRNQYVEKFNIGINLLNFSVNILKGKANEILELSRNNVREKARMQVSHNALVSILRYINDKYDSFDRVITDPSIKLKPYASAILEANREFIEEYNLKISFTEDWKSLDFLGKNKNGVEEKKSIRQLFQYGRVEYLSNINPELRFYKKGANNAAFVIYRNGFRTSYECFKFLLSVLHQNFSEISFSSESIILSKDHIADIIEDSKEAKVRWFRNYLSQGAYARDFMPCVPKYELLRIADGEFERTFIEFGVKYPLMVCPYIRLSTERKSVFFTHKRLEYKVDDNVIKYVYEHRYDKKTTEQQIRDTFETFRVDYSEIIEEANTPIKKSK